MADTADLVVALRAVADALESLPAEQTGSDGSTWKFPPLTDVTVDVDREGPPLVVFETDSLAAYSCANHLAARHTLLDGDRGEIQFDATVAGQEWRFLVLPDAPIRYTVITPAGDELGVQDTQVLQPVSREGAAA